MFFYANFIKGSVPNKFTCNLTTRSYFRKRMLWIKPLKVWYHVDQFDFIVSQPSPFIICFTTMNNREDERSPKEREKKRNKLHDFFPFCVVGNGFPLFFLFEPFHTGLCFRAAATLRRSLAFLRRSSALCCFVFHCFDV